MADDILEHIPERRRGIIQSLRQHATELLDHSPRFRYFTLHGKQHLENLFKLVAMLNRGGLRLDEDESFLLAAAICVHDLGMVVSLEGKSVEQILGGKPQPADPANLENFIRSYHHELVTEYISEHFDFLTSCGLNLGECALIKEISRSHRKVDLAQLTGHPMTVGALLRVVDELDVSPSRAPASVLLENYTSMDATSCWHWYKHVICEAWMPTHNVTFEAGGIPKVTFRIAVHPTSADSIPYWLNQIRRPLFKALLDEGAGRIVREKWGIDICVDPSSNMSSPLQQGERFALIEQRALSSGRRVILVVDDEVRKMEDLFLPLMQDFHVIFSPNAKDALDKMGASRADLVVVDLQVGSGCSWSPTETANFKMTGVKLCEEIRDRFPTAKVGILTGSRHDLSEARQLPGLSFFMKKPVDPDVFERDMKRILQGA